MEKTITAFMNNTTTQFDKLFTELQSAPERTQKQKIKRNEVFEDVEDTEEYSNSYERTAMQCQASISWEQQLPASGQNSRHFSQLAEMAWLPNRQ